jgi:multiple sugar transport system ATP-binding protein
MNFLHFNGALTRGTKAIQVNGAAVTVPEIYEDHAESELVLGVRPEHIAFDEQSALRGAVFGAEYMGTTQIVTVETAHGQVKARMPADVAARAGETVGLKLRPERLSLFEKSGRAIRSALHERGSHG